LKIITAFGLILSLLILSVAAIIALVAVLVAVARSGSGRDQQGRIIRQVRAFFLYYSSTFMVLCNVWT